MNITIEGRINESDDEESIYDFHVVIRGRGENADEAWRDACEGFCQDFGGAPDDWTKVED